ncbi:MAG TPA: VWA domain-containing protein [Candidatus Aminicenantes bacterium]|nr:VWA domain-containing protein [Candidatus Aminicenantes bacterium]HRY64291.1 VWA domain-containing protein [Candidatus Aminicenantes bacterium]HRZ71204.1 VWA domain-containing protein [Candidatus Aminicenantes bacterium]
MSARIRAGLRFHFLLWSLTSIWAIAATPRAWPQDPQKAPQPLRHEVSVTLKLIQVSVTDKAGKPVLDLEKDDFIVLDDGVPVKITEFERHELTVPAADAGNPEEKPEPVPAILKRNRMFFFFFDFAYNNTKGVVKARQAALHFIDTQFLPADEVGILTYTLLDRLVLQEYPTTNHQRIRDWVSRVSPAAALQAQAEDYESGFWAQFNPFLARESNIDGAGVGAPLGQKTASIQPYSSEPDRYQALHYTDSLKNLGRALRYIPGQKGIIFFSSGIPRSLIYGIQGPYAGRPQDTDFIEKYDEMMSEMAASNVVFFALDTQPPDKTLFIEPATTGRYPLQRLSKETGGKYFGNIVNYEMSLDSVQSLTGSFYVLGYYAGAKEDGSYRPLKVKLRRAGCRISAPKGYFNPKPFGEYSELERMFHLVDLAVAEDPVFQIPLRFLSMALPYSAGDVTRVAVFSKIPLSEIKPEIGNKVEIMSLVFDQKDNIVGFNREEADFTALSGPAAYHYFATPLKPGGYRGRIVIRDLVTGRGAVGSASVVVKEKAASGMFVYPPLLVRPEAQSLFLGASPTAFPFDTSRFVPVLEDVPDGAMGLQAVVRCEVPGIKDPEIVLSSTLVDGQTGAAIPISCPAAGIYRSGETRVIVCSLELGGRRRGRYAVHFAATERTANVSARAAAVITLK